MNRSKSYQFLSNRRIISLMHSSILRRIWFNFHDTLFFPALLQILQLCIRISNFFGLSITDWLIIYDFTSRSRIFHLYWAVTIAGEGLQNLRLFSALRAFEQGGIFIVPHLLWHWTSVFPVSSEGPPHLVAFYDTRGDVEDL
jgi:hypothetical protein